MDTTKIIENLVKITSNENTLKPEMFEKSEYWWIRNGTGVFLDEKDINYLKSALDGVLEDEFIKNNFPVKYIDDKLKDIISDAFRLEKDKRKEFIEGNLNSLRDSLKSEIKEWIFWIPLHNLSIDETLHIGDVKFFIFDKIESEKIEKSKSYKEHIDDINKMFINPNINKTLAEVKVRGIQNYAKLLAIKKINLAINVMKLFLHPTDSQFGIEGEICPSTIRYMFIYTNNDDEPLLMTERVGELHKIELKKEHLEFMKKHGINELNNILKKKKTTDYESRLLNSIYWFGEALSVPTPDAEYLVFKENKRKHENLEYFNFGEKAVKLFIALESVLIFDIHESINENIPERVAMIRGKNYERRKATKALIEDLYELRRGIVQDGNVFVSKYDLLDLIEEVRWVLINLVKLKIKFDFDDRNDLKKYIERLKFTQIE